MLNFLERSNRLPKDIDVLAATTLPADGEVFAVNREEFPNYEKELEYRQYPQETGNILNWNQQK